MSSMCRTFFQRAQIAAVGSQAVALVRVVPLYVVFVVLCVHGLRATAVCPGEVATPILKKRPVEPSAEDKALMLQEEDMGRTIRFIAEMPPHVCINELVIAPVHNRIYIGGSELQRR